MAALVRSLARNHALVDGDKRTAWVSARLCAQANRCRITAPSPQDIVDLVLAAVEDEKTAAEIAAVVGTW